MEKTTVVNVRRSKYDVYMGRAGHGHDGYFGNPFSIGIDGDRDKVIALYREYFYKRLRIDPEFAARIEELRDTRLGCYCKPKDCHCDIIVEYLENTMKVIVCGSRKWTSQDTIYKRLSQLPPNTIIVEGGCDGADLIARHVALINIGLEVVEFPAAWKKYDKAAGPLRNIKMLNTNPDLVIAFHNDLKNSKGTKHIITEARKREIEVEVISESVSQMPH